MLNYMLYIYTLLSLAVLDGIWLTSMGFYYRSMLSSLMAPTVNYIPAIIFYPLYAVGILVLVLLPAVRAGSTTLSVLLSGLLLGLVAYGAYDLTNHATLKDWPLSITLIDMAWGAFVTGASAVIAFSLYNYFH